MNRQCFDPPVGVMRRRWPAARRCAAVGLVALVAATGAAEVPPGSTAFQRRVRPLLQQYCAPCHADGAAEGGWALDAYPGYAELVADQAVWGKADQLVRSHVMPPDGEPAPSLSQRQAILDWIDAEVFYVDPAVPDPGRTTLRRLNRAEYNNSVRDVLGIDSRPADRFPPDDTGYGFDNIGDVLSLSPLHLEKYLAAASEVATEAVSLQPPPRLGVELTADQLETLGAAARGAGGMIVLRSAEDAAGTRVHVPVASHYKIFVRLRVVERHGDGNRIEIWCDEAKVGQLDLDGQPRRDVLAELPAGEHRISLRLPERAGAQAVEISFLGVAGPFAPTPLGRSTYLREHFAERALAPPLLRISGEDLEAGTGRSSLDTGKSWFTSNGYRRAAVYLPESGVHRLRFLVGAQQAGEEAVRFEVRLADRVLGPFAVDATAHGGQWIQCDADLPAGEHELQVWFVNEYQDPDSGEQRWLWVHELTVEGPTSHVEPLDDVEVKRALTATARRLFRRPPSASDRQRIEALVHAAAQAKQPPLATLQIGLEALLLSPHFLFHPQASPAGEAQAGSAPIDSYALAARLSSFLWSSAPDEELLALAAEDRLRANLGEQVERMLRDPKSAAFTENFAGQWLQLRDLGQVTPDPETFPGVDAELLADMRRESERFFDYILHDNRPVTELLEADYTFVNARLARHYGLPEPAGDGFQQVSLRETPRGGIITHGSILTLTSHPTRTSPVKRGKWLLEQLLGTPPPPAPADVPPLPETPEDVDLPLRVRLQQHSQNAACASCHAFLDPMGFAMEHYDAVGRWRDTDGGQTIDASGRLVTGQSFADLTELRGVLVKEHQDDFLRCLTEHLLTYALGRGVTYHDKHAVREIIRQTSASQHRFQTMILAVCRSAPFQRMRIAAEQQ